MSDLSPAMAADVLGRIEEELRSDPSFWKESSVDFWPLVRTHIGHNLSVVAAGALNRNFFVDTLGASGIVRVMAASGLLNHGRPLAREGGVWLFGNGLTYSELEGRAYDRLCDPLARAAADLGLAVRCIDRSGLEHRDSHTPRFWTAAETLRAKLLGAIRARSRRAFPFRRMAERVNLALRREGLEIASLSPDRLAGAALAISWLADRYEARLRRDTPEAVFMVTYFDVAGMAMCLAARRAGVPSFDIQHGVAGRYHHAYGHFRGLPSTAYELMPTGFWCWSQDDADAILEWAGERHLTCVGGHPFVSAWALGWVPGSTGADREAASLKSDRPVALVTLQAGLDNDTALAPVLGNAEALREWDWWFRLHPLGEADRQPLNDLLRSSGIENYRIDEPTRLPLLSLLRVCEVHVTHSSSSTLEAQHFGVPSVILSEYGASFYRSAISAGHARAAVDSRSFVDALGWALDPYRTGTRPPASPRDALSAILDQLP